jgi:predicted RNA-binding Zn-ribbon protein involved in translation (DUF1610 family)
MEYLILAIAVIIIITFFRSPVGKGIIGEFYVKLVIGGNKKDKKYVINNLMIVNDGKSSQIDHIVINQKGIFVIETKYYAGRIYGDENHKEWTQVLAYGKVKNKFYSPILQNKTHIYALSEVLGRKEGFISIIVFPKATLMTKTITNVGYLSVIRRTFKKQTLDILTIDEMNQVYSRLLEYKKNPQVTNREHVKAIKVMKDNINNNICPRCGKTLVLRNGKHGQFYGCSGYPDCKFKKFNN